MGVKEYRYVDISKNTWEKINIALNLLLGNFGEVITFKDIKDKKGLVSYLNNSNKYYEEVTSSDVQGSCMRNSLSSLNAISKDKKLVNNVGIIIYKCLLGNSIDDNVKFFKDLFSDEHNYNIAIQNAIWCIANNIDFTNSFCLGLLQQVVKDCIAYGLELSFVNNENHEALILEINLIIQDHLSKKQ